MPNNPIEKITDDGFTSTSKGLLTLFTIGVIKIFLGIEFTSSTISIPWLPTVEIYNLKNIIYLYWALVVYAIHRYLLHNYDSFRRMLYDISLFYLYKKINTKKRIIKKILIPNGFDCQIQQESYENNKTIKLSYFQNKEYPRKPCFDLYINHSNKNRFKGIKIYIHESDIKIDNFIKKFKPQHMNLCKDVFEPDIYHSNRIPLLFIVLLCSIYTQQLLNNKELYDISIPIILNILLFFYWCAMQYVG